MANFFHNSGTVLLLSLSKIDFGQASDGPSLLKVLKGVDDPKSPLILLANPMPDPKMGASEKIEPDAETTLTLDDQTTLPTIPDATTESKSTKKPRQPQKKKPFIEHQPKQKLKVQDFLSMPAPWDSLPMNVLEAMSQQSQIQPIFYPMPVYIPYPIPFMLTTPMRVTGKIQNNSLEEKISERFNQRFQHFMSEGLFSDDTEWQRPITKNRMKPFNLNSGQKWQGKWRKTTPITTSTTTATPPTNTATPPTDPGTPPTKPTPSTRLLEDNPENGETDKIV
ncbi:hypothetical protein KR018_002191 [Drosophila ironensis]|nr:hypothetical protein KR018_002191 [Drosophila ironensis]